MKYRFVAIGLLLVMFWLEISTLSMTAATPDEPMHILRGYAFVARGIDRIGSCVPCSPVLSGALIGTSLSLAPNLQAPPVDDPGWADQTAFGFQQSFLWQNNTSPQILLLLARLPILFVSLLLGALLFRWASQRSGSLPALGTLTLYVFCPNILANARLATTDVVTTATFALSAYTFMRALESTCRGRWVVSGIALGLALAAKISAVWLPVAFVLITIGHTWSQRSDRRAWLRPIGLLIGTGIISAVTLWGVYRFTLGPISTGGISVPAPAYWGEWQAFNDYLKDPLPGYLLGQTSKFGWWYYFPIAFLVKTTLPELILLLFSLVHTFRTRAWYRDLSLSVAPGLLLGSLVFSPHDLGYRYLLPLLPFVFVYGADVIKTALNLHWTRVVIGFLIIWQAIGTLRYYPYYLTFFNEIVGGPDRGRYILIDSNLDWGQDLPSLKQYVDAHHITSINFSYSGATPPGVYGLRTAALPPVYPAMRDQGTWWLHTYYPADPAPGTYAISVNPLMTDNYDFFRARTPTAIVGNSIYIYDIPAHGSPTAVSLSGLQVDQIDAETFKRFGTNDVRLRWFDATTSLIASPDQAWVAISDQQPVAPELAGLLNGSQSAIHPKMVYGDQSYRLFYADLGQHLLSAAQHAEQSAAWSPQSYPVLTATNTISLPVMFGNTAELIGYELKKADQGLTLITYWRAGDQIVTPLQMFVHAVGPGGTIEAQADRLDAAAFGWRSGDLIAQVNHLTLNPASDAVWVEIGLYNSDSGERVPVRLNGQSVDSRLLLQRVERH